MKTEKRRKELLSVLFSQKAPISGSELSKLLGCSRQIIVSDIAALKDSGYDIIATNKGYILNLNSLCEKVFKVRHTGERTLEELNLIVDAGGIVADVFVWHKVYGKIRADLNIFSKDSIDKFMDGIKSGKSTELMHITDGYHYHTVRADSEEILENIGKMLSEKGFLVPEI